MMRLSLSKCYSLTLCGVAFNKKQGSYGSSATNSATAKECHSCHCYSCNSDTTTSGCKQGTRELILLMLLLHAESAGVSGTPTTLGDTYVPEVLLKSWRSTLRDSERSTSCGASSACGPTSTNCGPYQLH
jgi:hypothetical protein